MRLLKSAVFFISMAVFGFGFGVHPEEISKPFSSAMSFAFLSVAIMIAWSEIRNFKRA